MLQIQLLEGFLESWTEYENNVQCLKTWFETQEKRLQKQQRIGDQASVQNALKDCQVNFITEVAKPLYKFQIYVLKRQSGLLN